MYTIGQSLPYQKLSQVVNNIDHGDTIFVQSGLYDNDVQVTISKDRIVILGDEDDKPILRAGSVIANDFSNGKGIMVIKGNHVIVRNLIFENARVPDRNGAGIRQEGCNLQIYNCVFRNNEMGILCGSYSDCKTTIEHCRFEGNGSNDNPGYQHNVYINHIDTLIFRFNVTANAVAEGHELKSRAKFNYIAYNHILNTESIDSRNIDISNGGQAIIIGNVVEQSSHSANSNLIGFGLEGIDATQKQELYLLNNTIVNRKNTGSFVQFPPSALDTIVIVNNAFCGQVSNQFLGTISHMRYEYNFIGSIDEAMFQDDANLDYKIKQNSPLKDKGIQLSQQLGQFNLFPEFEIIDEAHVNQRISYGQTDIGAYEFVGVDAVVTESKKDGIIFPNPSDDLLNCNDCKDGIYTILDLQGHQYQLIFHQHQTNVSHLKQGMYFLKTGLNVVNFLKK